VITVLADSPSKRHFDLIFGGLLHTCTDAINFAQDDGNVFKWLKATSGSRIKRQLVYTWLHMLLMLGRFVYGKVKSGRVQKPALAVVQKWAVLVTISWNCLIIRACALRSLSKSLVLRALTQEERSQFLQLQLDDDTKPADAQGNRSDSSKGSGNGNRS
jgi:hypothetical protein